MRNDGTNALGAAFLGLLLTGAVVKWGWKCLWSFSAYDCHWAAEYGVFWLLIMPFLACVYIAFKGVD